MVFQDKAIRRVWHHNRWYFSVIDVVGALEASTIPKRYWSDLKQKLEGEGFEQYDKIVQLKLAAGDGKLRETDCADSETMFRIIQSVPSRKAEPFKKWLAKVGYERVQEIEDPELAQERMKVLYEQNGYSKEWIEKRLRGIAIRQELTGEWSQRGIEKNVEFAMLTNEICKAAFGKTVEEYKKLKNLENQNLRDHMNDLELIFTMLGEKMTTEITKKDDSQGFGDCKDASQRGGRVAGQSREVAEKELGQSITTPENFLDVPEMEKRKRLR